MSTEYSDKINSKVKAGSIRAFELLKDEPESATTQTVESRSTLYNWLINVEHFTKAPSLKVSEDDVKAFEAAQAATGTAAALSEIMDKALAGHRGLLLSRQDQNFLWEQTGFHSDLEVQAVFAKIGKLPYQPIGFDNGTGYIPLEGSKTLWTREFALAFVAPLEPAFKIEKRADRKVDAFEKAYLTPEQVATYKEAVDWFNTDLKQMTDLHAQPATGERDAAILELENKIKETVKLACIRIPPLDVKLAEMEAKYGDVTGDLFKFVTACREYVELHLNENAVRQVITTTELLTRDGSAKKSAESILATLKALLSGDGKLAADEDTVASSLSAASVAVPGVRVVLNDLGKEAALIDGLRAAITYLAEVVK